MTLQQTSGWTLTLAYAGDPRDASSFEVRRHPNVFGQAAIILNWRDDKDVGRRLVFLESELRQLLELAEGVK